MPVTVKVEPMQGDPEGECYTLTNENGMRVKIITYGAAIFSIEVPDINGKVKDVVLGLQNAKDYKNKANNPYFGATVGRVCHRIFEGRYSNSNKTCIELTRNDGCHQLNGGIRGFTYVHWKLKSKHKDGVTLIHTSKHKDEGYQGVVTAKVQYRLIEYNTLKVHMEASTNRETLMNMTNHTYFNLAGHSAGKTELDKHEIQINAEQYMELRGTYFPCGRNPLVSGSVYDLQQPTPLGERLTQLHELTSNNGFDDYFMVTKYPRKKRFDLPETAKIYHPPSGREMIVSTKQPVLRFYTANTMPKFEQSLTKDNACYGKHSGFCLMPQLPHDTRTVGLNAIILAAGKAFQCDIAYSFGVVKAAPSLGLPSASESLLVPSAEAAPTAKPAYKAKTSKKTKTPKASESTNILKVCYNKIAKTLSPKRKRKQPVLPLPVKHIPVVTKALSQPFPQYPPKHIGRYTDPPKPRKTPPRTPRKTSPRRTSPRTPLKTTPKTSPITPQRTPLKQRPNTDPETKPRNKFNAPSGNSPKSAAAAKERIRNLDTSIRQECPQLLNVRYVKLPKEQYPDHIFLNVPPEMYYEEGNSEEEIREPKHQAFNLFQRSATDFYTYRHTPENAGNPISESQSTQDLDIRTIDEVSEPPNVRSSNERSGSTGTNQSSLPMDDDQANASLVCSDTLSDITNEGIWTDPVPRSHNKADQLSPVKNKLISMKLRRQSTEDESMIILGAFGIDATKANAAYVLKSLPNTDPAASMKYVDDETMDSAGPSSESEIEQLTVSLQDKVIQNATHSFPQSPTTDTQPSGLNPPDESTGPSKSTGAIRKQKKPNL